MPKENDIVIKASEFVSALFGKRLPEYLVYHTYEHSAMVARTARKIGKGMKLGEEGIEIVTLAGWLHDTGYTEIYRGHEDISIRIARQFLQKENYPQQKIALVCGCIAATKIPQQPKNLLEEIVADADLSGLGKKTFFKQGELLHIEWEKALAMVESDGHWAQQNLDLLKGHKFFTSYAQGKYGEGQEANIRTTYKTIRTLEEEKEQQFLEEENERDNFSLNNGWDFLQGSEPEVMPQRLEESPRFESSANDKKAQMIIIANIVTLTASIITLFLLLNKGILRTIVIIPFFLLVGISMLTVIFSILSVRPVILDSNKTVDPIMIANRSRYLHYSYNLFLYGIPVCAVLFIILFFLVR